jgi:hypothetical protein
MIEPQFIRHREDSDSVCEHCDFWYCEPGNSGSGECRRRAPQCILTPPVIDLVVARLLEHDVDDPDAVRDDEIQRSACWPVTGCSDFCGEFERRAPAQSPAPPAADDATS